VLAVEATERLVQDHQPHARPYQRSAKAHPLAFAT
jgi:hypothetical protein